MPADGKWIVDALRRHERSLCRYAHRLVGDAEAARDIVQDCFLRLCRQPRARVADHVAEWLFTVCRNRAFDHLRKEGRMDTSELQDRASGGEAPPHAAEREEQVSRLRRKLAELPERQQEVVRLKFQEGMTYKQIAAVTDVSVSNVGFLLHTALRTLRARLGDQSPPGEKA